MTPAAVGHRGAHQHGHRGHGDAARALAVTVDPSHDVSFRGGSGAACTTHRIRPIGYRTYRIWWTV
jgi:hypothetical protein